MNLKQSLIGKFSFKRLIRSTLIISVLLYILLMVFAFKFADNIIFQPQTPTYVDNLSVIKIETENGEKISGKYYKNDNAEMTILFSHGNAEDLGTAEGFLKELQSAGFSVFAYDYRGYGTSDGKPTEENSYQDIKSAYKYLINELKISPDKIILHGRSLGGAISIDLASKGKCGGLIVESSFVSAFRVMTGYKILPFDKFESITKLKDVKCPILFIHGKKDSLIPIWHGKVLFDVANEPKYNFWIDTANHNDVFQISREDYLSAIKDFSAKIAER